MTLRKVAIERGWVGSTKRQLTIPTLGWFHCWAGTSEVAYALIETADGFVQHIDREDFRFVKSPQTGGE